VTPSPLPIEEQATHAGGVVYRRSSSGFDVMLVSARSAPNERVLPKGHIDPGETPQETAVRETREESGVLTHVVGDLGYLKLMVRREPQLVHVFLLEAFGTTRHVEPWRKVQWLPLEKAVERASHEESKRMIVNAREILRLL
jgi:8-oxo-dGTP pyrophosphatase MutT (NUDIX family)